MVRRLFSLIHKEIGGLHEAAYLLGFAAILSQLLALVRDRLLAHQFGASATLDVYYASFRIPDVIFLVVGSLVSVSVLVPFLIERMEKGKEEGREFLSEIFTLFLLTILVICGAVFLAMPFLVSTIFSGFPLEERESIISMSRILLLSPILLGLSNLFGSVTQVYKRFFLYALSPLLYNVGIITGVIFFYPAFGMPGLVYGVVLGAVMHVVLQWGFLYTQPEAPRVRIAGLHFASLRSVVLLSLPRAAALSLNGGALLVLTGLASYMHAGSIAVFNFAYALQAVPISIIGVSYSVAAFPVLAQLFTRGDRESFLQHIVTATRHMIFLSLPITALLVVLRAQIVRTILGSGAFSWANTRLTAAALALFVFSLIAQNLVLLFIRGYYASGATRKPLFVNTISTAVLIGSTVASVIAFDHFPAFRAFIESLLKVEGIPGTEILMLPFGYSIGMLVNLAVFWILFERDFKGFSRQVVVTAVQSLAASIVVGVVAYWSLDIFDDLFGLSTLFGIFLQGFLSGVFGILAGIAVLLLVDSRELSEINTSITHRIWRRTVISSGQEDLRV